MRKLLLGLMLFLGACASPAEAPSQPSSPAAAATAAPARSQAQVDEAVSRFIAATGIENVSVVVMRGEEVLYLRRSGSHTADTVLPLASATKWITGATILSAVERGALTLDDPVGRWLPELGEPHKSLTLRQILSYTAGFRSLRESGADVRQYKQITLAEAVTELAATPLADAPGSAFAYGGVGFQFAGAALEAATGKTWNAYFREVLGDGLDMDAFYWSNPAGPNPPETVRNPLLQGGAATTLDDYAAFLTMIAQKGEYRGRRYLSAASIRILEAVQTKTVEMKFVPPGAGSGSQYNLAHWCEREGPGGCDLLSSPGAFGAYPWIDRKTGLHGVVFLQDQLARIADDVRRLRDASIAAFAG